ncbi:hypothetical protein M501DRAFT_913267, partial [Patellaria atrata CBS 101060]
AAKPARNIFDPWNSVSLGHQRAENTIAGSTSWHASRNLKLGAQFTGGAGDGKRVADTVGEGSESFGKDGRSVNGNWKRGASKLRKDGQLSIWESMGGKVRKGAVGEGTKEKKLAHPKLFNNLVIYINGSTSPVISDHKLKHLLATHGALMSISLTRRSVTHVIIGQSSAHSCGAGGGLAGSKMQKEITSVRSRGVKFVTAEWVIESLRAGIRQPESRFAPMKLAARGQGSVRDMF